MIIIIYRPSHFQFLCEIANITPCRFFKISNLKINFVYPEDPLRTADVSVLDSVQVNQNVTAHTYNGGHTHILCLILAIGFNLQNIFTFTQSNHDLVTFKMCLRHNICTLSCYHVKHTFMSVTAERFINSLQGIKQNWITIRLHRT